MSTNLYVRPKLPEPDGVSLPFELKKAIAPRYYDHDGSLGGDWIELDYADKPFIEGLKAGGVDGAEELLDAIKQFGVVEIALIG